MSLKGTFRFVSGDSIQGWALIDDLEEALDVVLKIDDETIAETKADLFREDLLKQGLHKTGHCGFRFTDLNRSRLEVGDHISLHVLETGEKLAGLPLKQNGELYKKNLPFIFIHIPKTAGTSFRLAAIHVFGNKATWMDYGPDSPSTSPSVMDTVHSGKKESLYGHLEKSYIKFFCGHINAKDYLPLFGKRARWCTFFRDPVQRVISDHKHVVRNYGYDKCLEEYCQMKWQRSKQYTYIEGLSLDDLYFLGITEDYDRSIQLFNKLSGSKLTRMEANKSKASIADEHEISPKLLELIKECNQKDIALYENAKIELERRLVRHGIGLDPTRSFTNTTSAVDGGSRDLRASDRPGHCSRGFRG